MEEAPLSALTPNPPRMETLGPAAVRGRSYLLLSASWGSVPGRLMVMEEGAPTS